MKIYSVILLGATALCNPALADNSKSDRPVMTFPADATWKQSFDSTEGSAGKVNSELRAALYIYSMLAEQGANPKRIEVAIVVHGSATFDFLTNTRYRERYGDVDNPNVRLVEEFLAKGGEIWMSGFGLNYRKIAHADLLPGVGVAPAGLIAHSELNRRGFMTNPFEGVSSGEGAPKHTPLEGTLPLSAAVRAGNVLYLSGDLGVAADGKGLEPGGIEPETRRMMERIGDKLAAHDLDFGDVIKCTVFLADMSEWAQFNKIYATYFETGKYPARSALGVSELAAGARVEMECLAWAG